MLWRMHYLRLLARIDDTGAILGWRGVGRVLLLFATTLPSTQQFLPFEFRQRLSSSIRRLQRVGLQGASYRAVFL